MLVRGTNINEKTLLATDYLNHFNEIVMLLDLIPDMPECLDDVKEWKPKSYQDHFRDSAFSDKELAVFAYDHVPDEYRFPFEEATREIDGLVLDGIGAIENGLAHGANGALRETVATITRDIQKAMDRSSAIINGEFGTEAAGAVIMDQSTIDALFD